MADVDALNDQAFDLLVASPAEDAAIEEERQKQVMQHHEFPTAH